MTNYIMHRGPRGRGPRIRISSNHHRGYGNRSYGHGGYSRRRSRGLFRIIASALIFKGIMSMAQSNPNGAKASCAKVKPVGVILGFLGFGAFIGGIIMVMTSNGETMPMASFIMILVGMLVGVFGMSICQEADYISRTAGLPPQDQNDNSNTNQQNQSTQSSSQSTVFCSYCAAKNPSTNNNCTSCGAAL